jgi:hypothetical protein
MFLCPLAPDMKVKVSPAAEVAFVVGVISVE